MTMINTTTWDGVEEALSALDELLVMFRVESTSDGGTTTTAATVVKNEQGQLKGKTDAKGQNRGQVQGSKKGAMKNGPEVVILD